MAMIPRKKKPDYLLLENSFFGLEPAKDFPPLMQASGPILADRYPTLAMEQEDPLKENRAIIYIAFGTRIFPIAKGLEKILNCSVVDISAISRGVRFKDERDRRINKTQKDESDDGREIQESADTADYDKGTGL